MEVGKLKKRIADFETQQTDFRKTFNKMRFFQFKCKRPYDYLAQANVLIMEMEKDMNNFQNSAVLFEVEVPKFEALHDCRHSDLKCRITFGISRMVKFQIFNFFLL